MKKIRISSFIFIVVVIFFIVDFIGYKVLSEHMTSDHDKNTKILFYEIKNHTSSLLSKLLVEYDQQKEPLKEKHQIVLDYMNTHDLDVDLDEIYQKINEGHKNKPYNIYITDKDLVIRNTTYEKDMGFDLTFAKKIFDQHKEENIIGCSTPIREKTSKRFLSFTDSYLAKDGDDKHAVVQVSYAYQDTTQEFNALLNIIQEYPVIKEVMAYSISSNEHIYEMVLDDMSVLTYKPTLERHLKTKKKALSISKRLLNHDLIEENFIKDNISYKILYMSGNYKNSENMKIIYTMLIDESNFYYRLKKLDIVLIIIALIAMITAFSILKLRSKEVQFSEQDKFVQSAMHEIKTPLSIITLNNELRQIESGTDTYSEEIDNALKVLHNSYRSMSYIMKKDKLTYEIETLNLAELVKKRIEYFQTIAKVNNKKIIFDIDSDYMVNMSLIELTRLIDNSLYNAIKYSAGTSIVTVLLVKNILSFHNQGEIIENEEKVFQKYYRENTSVGGYGLGLSIIKDIADKYNIDIKLESNIDKGTTFTYIFKCHTSDISVV